MFIVNIKDVFMVNASICCNSVLLCAVAWFTLHMFEFPSDVAMVVLFQPRYLQSNMKHTHVLLIAKVPAEPKVLI